MVYFAGLFASLVYVSAGWLAMTTIVRRSRRVILPDGSGAYVSPLIAAPLTAGVFKPCVILPSAWRDWPEETLVAVLTHERTHMRRRDPLVALFARLNRCVFWFHPLAWWLYSRLAASAEYVCDEAAARVCPPVVYARALVEIADDVRRNGGRLAWQGIAVGGNGRLKARIDRILSEPPWTSMSRGKKVLVAGACLAAIGVAVACRPATKPPELRPNPTVAQREADQKARAERMRAAQKMTPEQVVQLEAAVARNPEDLGSREKLLLYYGYRERKLDAGEMAARREHVLWTIDHHPESELAGSWGMRLFTTNKDPNPDPDGYAQAKQLWLAQIGRDHPPVHVFVNAAHFFETADKPLAEANWLKAAEREPGKWSPELGRLYAFTLMGSNASMPLNVLRNVSMTDAHSPYAQQVRQKLDSSSDVKLLTSAGQYLLFARQFNTMGETASSIDFDVQRLGIKYLQRALELDPNAVVPAALLYGQRVLQQNHRLLSPLNGLAPDARVRAIAALPEQDRLNVLAGLIAGAYYEGESQDYYKKDKAAAKAAWERLKIHAEDALTIGPRNPGHPAAGEAMFNAHIFLGTIALWDGDVRTALQHLRAAPDVPASDGVKYAGGIASSRLARYLLKAGEHQAVAEYYDRMATVNLLESASLKEAAQAIRAGRMPAWYQWATTREAAR
ncbi:MAG: hypothetical protein DMF84_25470 [Acidobacteria bacterium]|nr:MAG: hypothetical protein DMF84_25470 [Acidobacteriota bacterium]